MKYEGQVENIQGEVSGNSSGGAVVGVGVVCMDILALVKKFPKPDEKIRTTETVFQGGGNVGNTLTGLSRLQVPSAIVTKVGDDDNGWRLTEEFKEEGIDTSGVVVVKGMPSSFTFVVICAETQTRTCINTPQPEPLCLSDMKPELLESIETSLKRRVSWLHVDGRIPNSDLQMVRICRARWGGSGHANGVLEEGQHVSFRSPMVSGEFEKDRGRGMWSLLPELDLVFSNANFPKVVNGLAKAEEGVSSHICDEVSELKCEDQECWNQVAALFESEAAFRDHLAGMCSLFFLSKRKLVVSTIGEKGSVGVMPGPLGPDEEGIGLADVKGSWRPPDGSGEGGGKSRVSSLVFSCLEPVTRQRVRLRLLHCSAWPLREGEGVKDSTGAGDAFIAGFIAEAMRRQARGGGSIGSREPIAEKKMEVPWYDDVASALCSGSWVASRSLTAVGSRPGLPFASKKK